MEITEEQINELVDSRLIKNLVIKTTVNLIDIRVGDLLPPFGSNVPIPECLRGRDFDEIVARKSNGSVQKITFETPVKPKKGRTITINGNPIRYLIEHVETRSAGRHTISAVEAVAHLDTPQGYVFLNDQIRESMKGKL